VAFVPREDALFWDERNMELQIPGYVLMGAMGIGETSQPVSSKEFRALCYTAGRATGGVVVDFDPPPFHTIKNFDLVVFQFSNPACEPFVFLLKNRYTPLLACASTRELVFHFPFTFIDFPELTATFDAFFHVLKKQELEYPWMWTERELAASGFSPSAIKEILYWKPYTVGEAVFNFWD
jgi:hypothetical protein